MTPLLDEVIKSISLFRHRNRGVKVFVYFQTDFMGQLLKEQHNNRDRDGIAHYLHNGRTILGHTVYVVFDDRHPQFIITGVEPS